MSQGLSQEVPGVMSTSLSELKSLGVLMVNSHFDYGNGYHGAVYLNPHRLFQQPGTIWRVAQDLIARLPADLVSATEVVSGPVMGGALLAHTIAGLMDGHRPLTHPACFFAPLSVDTTGAMVLRTFYREVVRGKRVLLVDDVRNTGKTFERAKALIEVAGGIVIATVQICDRLEAVVDLGVPNIALAEYPAPENYPAAACPLCIAGVTVATF
jgi:orotate phosphoribosyltransferase